MSLHTRVTLWVSGVLLVAGALFILAVEWTNEETLGGQPVGAAAVRRAGLLELEPDRAASRCS